MMQFQSWHCDTHSRETMIDELNFFKQMCFSILKQKFRGLKNAETNNAF